jgi:MFS family permease
LPLLVISIFGGVIADRFQKKYILMLGEAVSMTLALMVAVTLTTGYLGADRAGSWWILMFSAVIDGTVLGIIGSARQVLVADIVGLEHVMNAVSLNNAGQNTLRLIAPALAGFLIDKVGFQAVYYTMTGLYVWGFIFMAFLPGNADHVKSLKHNVFNDIKDGFIYIRNERIILLVLIGVLCGFFLATPYQGLLPIFIDNIFKVGATGLGLLSSLSGAGAIIFSFILASLKSKKRGLMLIICGLVMGLTVAAFAFTSSWYLALVMAVFIGAGQTGQRTLGNTLLQTYTKKEFRGRVMSVWGMQLGLTNFGAFFASLLVSSLGVQWSVGGFALLLVLLSLLAFVFVPLLRKLD